MFLYETENPELIQMFEDYKFIKAFEEEHRKLMEHLFENKIIKKTNGLYILTDDKIRKERTCKGDDFCQNYVCKNYFNTPILNPQNLKRLNDIYSKYNYTFYTNDFLRKECLNIGIDLKYKIKGFKEDLMHRCNMEKMKLKFGF